MAEIEAFDPAAFAAFKRQAGPGQAPEVEEFDPGGFAAFKAQAVRGPGPQSAVDLAFGGESPSQSTPATDTPMGRFIGLPGAAYAAASGALDGVPVIGPTLTDASNRTAAAIRSWRSGDPYETELKRVQDYDEGTRAQHPVATTAGGVAGAVGGLAPAMIAAPEIFGAGAGGLLGRSIVSAASGSGIGAADAAVRSGGDIGEIEKGAGLGAVGGGIAPTLGRVVGAGAQRAYEAIGSRLAPSTGFGPAASRVLAEDVANSGGVAPVRARLGELGPDAMLLDASPSFQGQAQGLAIHPETQQAVTAPIAARAAGMTDRLAADVNGALGPAVSPQTATNAFAAAREVPNQSIGATVRAAGPIDTTDVLANLADRLRTAEGPQRAALMQARGMLMTEHPVTGMAIPQTSAENLQNAKIALSGMMEHGAEGLGVPRGSVAQREGALGSTVGDLNRVLRDQIPGYATANDLSSALARRMEAVEAGSQLLRSGEAATPPADLTRRLAGMSQGERDAMAIGSRGAIDRAVGTRRNDLTAMQGVLQGEGGWNAANLAQLHGQGPVDRVVGAVNREAAFDQANRRIVEGSQSAQRLQSAARTAPREVSAGSPDVLPGLATVLHGTDAGMSALAAKAGMGGLKLAVSSAQNAADLARNRELARAVTMRPGAMMDQFLDAIGVRDAVARRAATFGALADRGAQATAMTQGQRVRPYLPAALPALPFLSR